MRAFFFSESWGNGAQGLPGDIFGTERDRPELRRHPDTLPVELLDRHQLGSGLPDAGPDLRLADDHKGERWSAWKRLPQPGHPLLTSQSSHSVHSRPHRRAGRSQTEHHHQADPPRRRRKRVVLPGGQLQRGQSSIGMSVSTKSREHERARARSRILPSRFQFTILHPGFEFSVSRGRKWSFRLEQPRELRIPASHPKGRNAE